MGIAWSQLDLNGHVFSACDVTGRLCNQFAFGKGNLDSTNGFGGGQFGYNFQGGNFRISSVRISFTASKSTSALLPSTSTIIASFRRPWAELWCLSAWPWTGTTTAASPVT